MLPSIFGGNMFDDFFGNAFDRSFFGGDNTKAMMKTDVKEHDNCYQVEMDVPGFQKDDISVDLKDGYLTVSASKNMDKNENDQNGRYIRQERYAGSCSRTFYVGDLKPEDIKCKYDAGVLQLTIPKKDVSVIENQSRIAIEEANHMQNKRSRLPGQPGSFCAQCGSRTLKACF